MTKVLVSALLLGCAAANVQAQHVVSDKRSCGTCRIELEAVATVGSEDGPGYIKDTFSLIFLDGNGRYWVIDATSPPRVFAANGAYIKTIGRMGGGPGEFSSPRGIFAAGDSTAILDRSRITLVGPDLVIARETPNPVTDVVEGLTLSWPRNVIVNAFASEPDKIGLPLHSTTFESAIAQSSKSFGSNAELLPVQQYSQIRTYMTPSKQGGFWTINAGRCQLTRWSSDGRMLEQIDRKPAWFSKESRWDMGSGVRPPEPRINGVTEDENGLLWVYFSVASPTYTRGWQRAPAGASEVSVRNIDYDLIFITRIEVIDPIRKRLVASTAIDRTLKGVLPKNRIVYFTSKNDAPLAAVYKPKLIR